VLERLLHPQEFARQLLDDWQGCAARTGSPTLLDLLAQRRHAQGAHTRATRLQAMRGPGKPCGVVGSSSCTQGSHTPRGVLDKLGEDLEERLWVCTVVQLLQRRKRRRIECG
jgi:hypothetical protein